MPSPSLTAFVLYLPLHTAPSAAAQRISSRRSRLAPAAAQTRRALVMAEPRPAPMIAVVEIGTGTDLHGQNATVAAVRACRNAIEFNSLPGLNRLLPGGSYESMTVHVKLGVPKDFMGSVDEEQVRRQFPYGQILVEVVEGGLCCSSGVVLAEQGDAPGDDRAVVVVAAVTVMC